MPVLNDADAVYLGDVQADAVYAGDVLVWPASVAWSPAMLSGLVAWYDAASLMLLDGEPVNLWPDLSTTRADLTLWDQDGALATTPPAFEVGIQNGRSVVRFGAGNALSTVVQPPVYRDVYAVVKYRLPLFTDYSGFITGHDGNEILFIGSPGSSAWYPPTWGGSYRIDGVIDAVRHSPMERFGIVSLSALTEFPLVRLKLGIDRQYPPRWWDGDVAEVIAYSRVLPDEERLQVETYLRDKWGTP